MPGTIPVSATLVPGGSAFGVVNASDQNGGWASVANETAIGAINAGLLVLGMQRYSILTAILYQLSSLTPAGGFANGTWQVVSAPSAGSWAAVEYASTVNIATLSGEQVIDGQTTNLSDVLLDQQTVSSQNGIWTTSTGAWARRADANSSGAFAIGKTVAVVGGNTLANTIWIYNGAASPTIGTTPLTFGSNSATSTAINLSSPPPIGNTTPNSVFVSALIGPSNGAAILPLNTRGCIWTTGLGFNVETLPIIVATTNATPALLGGVAIPNNQAVRIDVSYKTGLVAAGDCLANDMSIIATNVSGTVVLTDSVTGIAFGSTTGKTWGGLSAVAAGTSIDLNVTGAASTNITWDATIDITYGN